MSATSTRSLTEHQVERFARQIIVPGVGAGMASGNAVTHRVFGELLASNNVGAIDVGSYTDVITATITY